MFKFFSSLLTNAEKKKSNFGPTHALECRTRMALYLGHNGAFLNRNYMPMRTCFGVRALVQTSCGVFFGLEKKTSATVESNLSLNYYLAYILKSIKNIASFRIATGLLYVLYSRHVIQVPRLLFAKTVFLLF